jgi:hypothetical protein
MNAYHSGPQIPGQERTAPAATWTLSTSGQLPPTISTDCSLTGASFASNLVPWQRCTGQLVRTSHAFASALLLPAGTGVDVFPSPLVATGVCVFARPQRALVSFRGCTLQQVPVQ